MVHQCAFVNRGHQLVSMIALRVLLISQVIVVLCSPVAYAVPVYGTKKYVRSPVSPVITRPISAWDQDVPNYRPVVRTQRHAATHHPYDTNPYASYYDNYYYHPREYYPVYYPKTSKYEVYQAVVPYYYNDAHSLTPSYMYDYNSADPIMDIEEDLLRQQEIAERENAQSIGQEMFYENDDPIPTDDNMDAINTAFLQNLIMTQIYNDAMDKNRYHPQQKAPSEQIYGKWDEYPLDNQDYYHSDDDERELKMVANLNESPVKDEDRLNFFNKGNHPNKKYASKRDNQFNSRKSNMITLTTSQPPVKPFRKVEGQKEVVLHRPATPVVHRMSQPDLVNEDKPSVYDTIKHMLNMEKELETHKGDTKRKRDIRSSEDSLTKQLSLLKKSI